MFMDLSKLFSEEMSKCSQYREALEIVQNNSSGNVWLIGGMVYRVLASCLYNLPKPEVDLDFVVENANRKISLPEGWERRINGFGNPKFVRGNTQIDFVPLRNIYSIIARGLNPSIDSFLSGNPLTIQAIAYDTTKKHLIGERGLDAIKRKVIEVNDLGFANYAAKQKGKTLQKYVQEKADELHFASVFPN
jgi:hypothetical protein